MINTRLLQPIEGPEAVTLTPSVYSVAYSINAGGQGHEEGTYHLHSRFDGIAPIPGDGVTGIYGEVGAWFGDEYCRAIAKTDLTARGAASSVRLRFRIADMQVEGEFGSADDPVSGIYGQNALCCPAVFPHDPPVPYSCTLRLVVYTPIDMSHDTQDFLRPAGLIVEFEAAGMPANHIYDIDVTTQYNAAAGGLFGLRIEDTHAYPAETWNQVTNEFGCVPGSGAGNNCWHIVTHPGGEWDSNFKRDGRGAITFRDFELDVTE